MHEKTNWADLNRDGRRLEGIIKMLNTNIHKFAKEEKFELMLAYINSLAKLTHEKVGIARIVLGIDELIKDVKVEDSSEWQVLLAKSS